MGAISADWYRPEISADWYRPEISADWYRPEISADWYRPEISADFTRMLWGGETLPGLSGGFRAGSVVCAPTPGGLIVAPPNPPHPD